MSDTTTTTTTESDGLPTVDDDETGGDRVELTSSGLVRLTAAGRRWRLRRPFLGEFKRMRLGLEDMTDAVLGRSEETQAIGRRIGRMVEVLNTEEAGDEGADDEAVARSEARLARVADLRGQSRSAARELTRFVDAERLAWWSDVFSMVSMDGPLLDADDDPDAAVPAWILADGLPATVMQHWRSVPLAPGANGRRNR